MATESTPIAPATFRSVSYSTTPSTTSATSSSIDVPQQSTNDDDPAKDPPQFRPIVAAAGTMSDPQPGEATTRNGNGSSNGRRTDGSGATPKLGWLKRMGSIELENKGSVARDHLALERTFLAWLRTSLAFASIGIAITQLFRLNASSIPTSPPAESDSASATDIPGNLGHIGKPLGATFLGIAILVLFLGINRYYESQAWLLKGKFPASRGSVFLLTLVAGLLIIASLVIILAVGPGWKET